MISKNDVRLLLMNTVRLAERLKTYDLRKIGNIRKLYKPHRMIA